MGVFSLGGLPCSCCSCSTTVCVATCGSVPVGGAQVVIKSGTTVVASGTTDATTGCVALAIPSAATYTVQVFIGGTIVAAPSRSLACGGTTTVTVTDSSVVCCGGYAIPINLTLTDAAGSLSFVHQSSSSPPTWWGGHAVTKSSCPVTTPGGVCVSCTTASSGPVRVCYEMTCNSGSSPVFALTRSWGFVLLQGTSTPIWYQDTTGFSPGFPCLPAPPASCGSPLTDSASDSQDPASSSPFAISFTPAPAGGNSTADPIGGSVNIS